MIDHLPRLAPDDARTARTVSQCHARLAARRRILEASTRQQNARVITGERLLAAGVCVVYLISMTINILGLTP